MDRSDRLLFTLSLIGIAFVISMGVMLAVAVVDAISRTH